MAIQTRNSSSRLLLIGLIIVILIVVAAFFLFHRSSPSAAAPPTPTAVVPTPTTVAFAEKQAIHDYATSIMPIIDRATRSLSKANAQVQARSGSPLAGACGGLQSRAFNLMQTYEGIPHPYPWYSNVGHLHHHLSGVFHDVLGAAQECQTAQSAGDPTSVATSKQDIGQAVASMHTMDARVHYLATH